MIVPKALNAAIRWGLYETEKQSDKICWLHMQTSRVCNLVLAEIGYAPLTSFNEGETKVRHFSSDESQFECLPKDAVVCFKRD